MNNNTVRTVPKLKRKLEEAKLIPLSAKLDRKT